MTATTSLPGTARAPHASGARIPELLADVLTDTIDPVLDDENDYVADAYAAMDERRSIKSLVRVGSL